MLPSSWSGYQVWHHIGLIAYEHVQAGEVDKVNLQVNKGLFDYDNNNIIGFTFYGTTLTVMLLNIEWDF